MPDPVTGRNLASNATSVTLQDQVRSANRAPREGATQRDAGETAPAPAAPPPSTQVSLSPEARSRAANDAPDLAGVASPQSVSAPERADAVRAPNTENRIANVVTSATAPGDQRRAAEVDARAADQAAQRQPAGLPASANDAPATVSTQPAPPPTPQAAAPAESGTPPEAPPVSSAPAARLPESTPTAAAPTADRDLAAEPTRESGTQRDAAQRQASQAVANSRQQATEITQNPFLVGAASTYRSVAEL